MARALHTSTTRSAFTIMMPWSMNSSVVCSTADFSAASASLWRNASAWLSSRTRAASCSSLR